LLSLLRTATTACASPASTSRAVCRDDPTTITQCNFEALPHKVIAGQRLQISTTNMLLMQILDSSRSGNTSEDCHLRRSMYADAPSLLLLYINNNSVVVTPRRLPLQRLC
jgi:hypothetical protein